MNLFTCMVSEQLEVMTWQKKLTEMSHTVPSRIQFDSKNCAFHGMSFSRNSYFIHQRDLSSMSQSLYLKAVFRYPSSALKTR